MSSSSRSAGEVVRLDLDLRFAPRLIWTSAASRQHWERPLRDTVTFTDGLMLESVADGLRDAALVQHTSAGAFWLEETLERLNLLCVPFESVAPSAGPLFLEMACDGGRESFCASGEAEKLGWVTRRAALPATSESPNAAAVSEAPLDSAALLAALGAPSCCAEAWLASCERFAVVDPAFEQVHRSAPSVVHRESPHHVRVEGYPHTNIMLRHLGLRLVPHLPCRFDCPASLEVGESWWALACSTDRELARTLLALLEMPLRWDVLKGVGVLYAQIFRVMFPSLPIYPRQMIDLSVCEPREYDGFSDRGATRGSHFPNSLVEKSAGGKSGTVALGTPSRST